MAGSDRGEGSDSRTDGNADSQVTSVDQEFHRVQRRWRRLLALRLGAIGLFVGAVLFTANWIGLDVAYLYAHRENFFDVLLGEMLDLPALWEQLGQDGPRLRSAAVETLAIAAVGTAFGLPFALLFGVLAASNVGPWLLSRSVRLLLGGLRAVPSMVYALLFVILAGLGPVAGALAIAVGTIGDLGRLFADELEEIDPTPIEAVQSTGAGVIEATSAARLPQVTTAYVAWTLFYLEKLSAGDCRRRRSWASADYGVPGAQLHSRDGGDRDHPRARRRR